MTDVISSDETVAGIPFVADLVTIGRMVVQHGTPLPELGHLPIKQLDSPDSQWKSVVTLPDPNGILDKPSIWLQGTNAFLKFFPDQTIQLQILNEEKLLPQEKTGLETQKGYNHTMKGCIIQSPIGELNIPTLNFLHTLTQEALRQYNAST